MKNFKIKHFIFTTIGLLLFSTIFFYPTKEPGAVVKENSFEVIDRPDIIDMAPIFGNRNDKLYSFRISPDLEPYYTNEPVMLLATTNRFENDFTVTADRHFSWTYWLRLIFIPSLAIGIIIGFISGKRKQS